MRRGRVERIDGRVDAELGDRAREHRGRVEVGERRRRRRVGEVVGGHVDGLHRGDRALVGRGDALLQLAHLGRQRRLVTDGRRDAAEERRHLGARLGEAEDVVDEEEHVLALFVAEVLGHGERRERDARRGRPAARSSGRRRAPSSRGPTAVDSFDSSISCQRSLPSRVRSPTPANTEKPPCFLATLLMSSRMRTVLPTPAPPNRPILPPRR